MDTVVSQEGADFLWPEGVGAGGHAGEEGVLHGVLDAKLLKVSCCLRDLSERRRDGLKRGSS